MKKLFFLWRVGVLMLGLPWGGLMNGQEVCPLPFSLQSTPANPNRTDMGAAPATFLLSHRSCMGFIKENGDYRLRADWVQKRNAWSVFYGYQGFKLLHRQNIGFAYARGFLPGLQGEIRFAYGFFNPVEDRGIGQYLAPGLSLSFQREKWGLRFAYDQRVRLRNADGSGGTAGEWNERMAFLIGANCRLHTGLYWGVDLEKDIRHPLLASTSLSYLLRSSFLFWLQAQVNPTAFQMGFGYYHPRFSIQIACRYHPPLGAESEIGVSLKLGGQKQKNGGQKRVRR
ncbi:MAG: hypothetical protein K2K11_05745 [Bacteroidales bacterium]|nr:hypothetical protein [Bacteroidales bacterium]